MERIINDFFRTLVKNSRLIINITFLTATIIKIHYTYFHFYFFANVHEKF
jgi:hypothetical protein